MLAWPAESAAIESAIADLRQAGEDDAARLSELPSQITAQEAIAASRPHSAVFQELHERHTRLSDIDRQLTDLDEAILRRDAAAGDVERSLERSKQSADEAQRAGRAYRAGIAAELALSLAPGEPCAVCGALEHPTPAAYPGERVALEDVERLTARASADQTATDAARTSWKDAEAAVVALEAAVTMTRDEWASAKADAAADLQAANDTFAQAEAADAALVTLRTEVEELTRRITGQRETLAAQTSAWEKSATDMVDAERAVTTARGPHASVAERAADIRRMATHLTARADRLADLAHVQQAHDDARQALAALPQHEAFGDTAGATKAWQEADEIRLAAEREAESARQRHGAFQQGADAIARLQSERATKVDADAALLALAEVFAPGRGSDMGVHIYVLRAMFENVMELANRRLESLLNGRYRLVPSDADEGDLRTLQGLGVSVLDGFTEKARPARSLSGGESFCVALALALGLSDAVRLNAGGIEIGSLFIDEGFGSLDADQLDEVMIMLGHLSRDGRRVGVISHVDSMKSGITERIEVTPAQGGHPAHLDVSWMP